MMLQRYLCVVGCLCMLVCGGSASVWGQSVSSDRQQRLLNDNYLNACRNGDLKTVRTLLSKGAYANVNNGEALRCAIDANNVQLAKFLLTKKVKIQEDSLEQAARYGNVDMMRLLVNRGCDVNGSSSSYYHGRTPLMVAAQYSRYEAVVFLIGKGAKIHQDREEFSVLHYAVKPDESLYVRGKSIQIDVNLKLIKYLLDKGADVNAVTRNDKDSVLHHAARRGNIEAIKLLLEYGANVSVVNRNGEKPYDVSSSPAVIKLLKGAESQVNQKEIREAERFFGLADSGNLTALKRQLEEKDINSTNGVGESLLHRAIVKKRKEVVEFLIKEGIDIDLQQDKGESPLHYAIKEKNSEMVELLILNGANLNLTDDEGRSPLVYAIMANQKQIMEKLIHHGADIEQFSDEGYAPLHYAIMRNRFELIESLLANGANVNTKTEQDKTCLQLINEIKRKVKNPQKCQLIIDLLNKYDAE